MDIQHIGRYDIKSLIGQGGMSAVYLGYDPRSQREVAIKILPPYYLHAPKFRERFEREALMIALLEHPAIVPVYDMGEEDDQPYIVMRYMSGGSLADKIKRGPIPLRECMEMYLRLAPALDTAHARGVTHRDVKPDNLLFDKYDNVFLSDFGLARLRETIGFANISDGSIMGTPAYMSPEQIQGDREIDGRSDIYSMGIVLYQSLCGVVPFSGTTAASVMMMHLVNPVPQIYEKNNTLPPAIQAVLETALAKNPKDRYQTAGEFARAIQAVTTGVQRRPSNQVPEDSIQKKSPRRVSMTTPPELPVTLDANPSAAMIPPAHINGNQSPIPAEPVQLEISTSSAESLPSPVQSSTSRPSALRKFSINLPWWGWLVGILIVLLVFLTLILRSQGISPFTLLSRSGNSPISSQSQSNLPAATLGVSSFAGARGQADKLAFLKSSDIWVSDLDGGNLTQLTTDGKQKSNLQWSPDGQSVIYSSANCLDLVGLVTKQVITLTCFTGVSAITTFDISPDGQKVALGLPQSDLYLLPYSQLFNLPQSSLPTDIPSLAPCTNYAPYNTEVTLKGANWSFNDSRLALLLSTLVNGAPHDEIRILDFGQCTTSPSLLKEILPTFLLFTTRGYYDYPVISSLSWDGIDQLLLTGMVNDRGFGDLQVYDLPRGKSQTFSPNGSCCYRDAHWSPDGTYLFYSYLPESGGDISLYYISSNELGQSGNEMASLALPAGFLAGTIGSVQPALRSAH